MGNGPRLGIRSVGMKGFPPNVAAIALESDCAIEIGPKALGAEGAIPLDDCLVGKTEAVAPPDAKDHKSRPRFLEKG